MSAIGSNINTGKQYNIYCTNLSVMELKNYKGLPANSIIISSPIRYNNDLGIPSIVMTDYESKVLPLTYTLNNTIFTVDESTNTINLNSYYLSLFNRIGKIEQALINNGINI